jgi:hypothetical protein
LCLLPSAFFQMQLDAITRVIKDGKHNPTDLSNSVENGFSIWSVLLCCRLVRCRMKWAGLVSKTLIAVAVVALAVLQFSQFEAARLRAKLNELEEEKQALADYARRLCASRRVAQVNVLQQDTDNASHTVNLLEWQEVRSDKSMTPPITVQAVGNLVYFEGAVLKFEHRFVGQGDPEKGTSLVLFRRIFGDQQTSESASSLAQSPALAPADSSEARLMARFWEFVANPDLATQYGIRVAQCEAPAVPLKPGQVWEISIDAAGGLNLKRLDHQPPT